VVGRPSWIATPDWSILDRLPASVGHSHNPPAAERLQPLRPEEVGE
jgi:hypothetical protein